MSKKWGSGKQTAQIVKEIESYYPQILGGSFLAIDPASRSLGYAEYRNGVLVNKGKITSKKKDVNARLQDISQQLLEKFKNIDLVAIEKIRGNQAHDYLRWSIGMVIVSVKATYLVEVPITFWKKLITEDYVKTDDNDAEMIGSVVVQIAEDINGEKSTWR